MGLNKTVIEWVDYTWVITQGCMHGCPYCYVKRILHDMTPKFNRDRLYDPYQHKKTARILTTSMGDLFSDWQLAQDIRDGLKVMALCPQHIFLLLTKNPIRMLDYKFTYNAWYGTSIESADKLSRLKILQQVDCKHMFISAEPMQGYMGEPDLTGIDLVIIGAETEFNKQTPKDVRSAQQWADPFIAYVRKLGIPLFLKSNLQWPEKIKECPCFQNNNQQLEFKW